MPDALTIAGVRFHLSGCSAADPCLFPAAFGPFLNVAGEADLVCEVVCLGPDPALAATTPEPDRPWSFTVGAEGTATLVRRADDGVALWRMRATAPADRVEIAWHPQRFEPVYGRYERAWNSGLGLTLLVFRLHAAGGLVFHGSAARLDAQGVLCAGVSGSGKSTIARLLDAAGATVLTDERPVVRRWPPPAAATDAATAATFRVHGSPWPSSAGFARREAAPLRRIYFLEHGAEDRIQTLAPPEAFRRLIQVATIPWQEPALFDPCLATAEALLAGVPCAVLAFRPTAAVVDAIRRDLARAAGEDAA
jgi:hypothetical protein